MTDMDSLNQILTGLKPGGVICVHLFQIAGEEIVGELAAGSVARTKDLFLQFGCLYERSPATGHLRRIGQKMSWRFAWEPEGLYVEELDDCVRIEIQKPRARAIILYRDSSFGKLDLGNFEWDDSMDTFHLGPAARCSSSDRPR